MAFLEVKSGPWQGWWVQGSHRGHQRLTLIFAGGRIIGAGADDSGEFNVFGQFDEADVWMVKRYAWWEVRYDGSWDGAAISGTWTIRDEDYFDIGEFEIWPVERERAWEEIEKEQMLELPAGPPSLPAR